MTTRKNPTAARFLARFSLALLLISGLAGYLYSLSLPVQKEYHTSSFIVSPGESARTIATHLSSANLLRSPLYFRLLVRLHRLTLQAGVYTLSASSSPLSLAVALTEGRALETKLTIPEGFRAEQIAIAAGFAVDDFLSALGDQEGHLFPDTYFVKDDITPSELIAKMQANFAHKVGQVDQATLILASLIERETRSNDEKPLVAGILKKRLDAGWPLELDATVQYALGSPKEWWPVTTLADRQISSPYNTYLLPGLPPKPIANPGLAAIQAAKNPTPSPYWFYLHDSSGTIHYATTNREHEENIDKYLR